MPIFCSMINNRSANVLSYGSSTRTLIYILMCFHGIAILLKETHVHVLNKSFPIVMKVLGNFTVYN